MCAQVNSTIFIVTRVASGDNSVHLWRLPKPEEKKDKPKEVEREREPNSTLKPWTPVLEKSEDSPNAGPLSQSPIVDSVLAPNPALNITASSVEQTEDGVSTFGVVTISRSVVELKHKSRKSSALV